MKSSFLNLLTLACFTIQIDSFSDTQSAKYDRKNWQYPTDLDRNCLNSRQELLKKESLIPPVVKKCKVVEGKWNDFYFPEVLTDPKQIDIDHVVPLKHAHDNGAAHWSRSQKKTFANDFENLVITNKKYNRKKGSKDLTQWLPVDRSYACNYFERWMKVKKKYSLTISNAEIEQGKMLKCKK